MEHVTLKSLAPLVGMDRSHLRRYVIKLGIKAVKIRESGQLLLAVSTDEADRIVEQRARDGHTTGAPVITDAGLFYIVCLVPDLDPRRVKLGFTQDMSARLATHRCSAPTAELVKAWPCKRQWESTAMEAVAHGARHILNECYEGDVAEMCSRAKRFFDAMPEIKKTLDTSTDIS